jgi:hypothetical protein
MEEWELEFEWLRVRSLVRERFRREVLPDLNAMLFLIGIQELGRWKTTFSKEEKQDLMHIAVCRLMSYDGYYAFVGRDADGWPHWELISPIPTADLKGQEHLLKERVIRYFNELDGQ